MCNMSSKNQLTCVKCPQPATLSGLDPKKAVYCQKCFVQMVKHKFASAIGRQRIFKSDETRRCLIVYDGTPSAALLIHLVAEGLAETAKKRLILEPTVMVILSRSDQSEIAEAIAQITQFQSMLPGNWVCVHLADIFDDERTILDGHVVDDERKILDGHRIRGLQHLDQWRELLQRTRTTTIQLELMRLVRLQLIYRYATLLQCSKIFVPDTADQLAKSTISVMALGRGVQIADMNSVVDRSHSAAIVLRPMREISKKEVALVNRLEKSDRFVVLLDEKVSACKAIQPITDCFVDFLQREGFRSTITAVLATACKAKVVQRSSDERCRLCFVALSDEIMPVNLCSPCSTVIEDIDASVRDAFLRCLSPFDSPC